jgi:transposase
MELKLIGIDTSKHVFTVHGVDERGGAVLRRHLPRGAFEPFMAALPASEVVLEACGGSHHWARRLAAMGHRVRLIAPQYVRPFVKRGSKNDRADAAAICEAAVRPDMRFVPVKSAEQQSAITVLRVRELLVRQHTQVVNALRGHAAEFGLVVPRGTARVAALLEQVLAEPAVPDLAREMLALLGRQLAAIEQHLAEVDAKLLALHRASAVSRRLAEVPGIGPVSAITLALSVEPAAFENGRHLAAWIGLVPKQHSTGGKPRLGSISRAGHERLRQLLVLGATSVIRRARQGSRLATPWLLQLLARKPGKLAAVALANKMARIVWAMMARGEAFRAKPLAGAA